MKTCTCHINYLNNRFKNFFSCLDPNITTGFIVAFEARVKLYHCETSKVCSLKSKVE